MRFESPSALLDRLLEGEIVTAADLDDIVATFPAEGQFHDFKNGKLCESAKAGRVLREYVSAFANGEGGVLVIGVSEERNALGIRDITGCESVGKPLPSWANDCITGLAGGLSPAPRFQTVKHAAGEVLLCAVARAPSLLSCNVEGRAVYYLRIGDANVLCPDYLISDLLLGRRSHPTLSLSVRQVTVSETVRLGLEHKTISLNIDFAIENTSLVTARAVRVGVVSFGLSKSPVSRVLERYIDNRERDLGRDFPWHLMHASRMPFFPQDVAPFNINIEARVENALVVPDLPGLDPICSAAVYALPDGSGPSWFQLRCATSQIKKDDDGRLNARKAITMQPSSRPEVNWIRIGSL